MRERQSQIDLMHRESVPCSVIEHKSGKITLDTAQPLQHDWAFSAYERLSLEKWFVDDNNPRITTLMTHGPGSLLPSCSITIEPFI